ncbi:HAMP domain-containing sensor histidine kinase [Lysinibacillus sp. 54212]|uniref:HAMP domain-containing sensor histidine kinase n=1 Tax=Lysinibacillus sp. 54212 TaxID=3119829 RepID=UPI002FCBF53A
MITKVVALFIAIVCLTGAIKAIVDTVIVYEADFSNINKDHYFQSLDFADESASLVSDLAQLIGHYKNEENILKGHTLTAQDIRNIEQDLYYRIKYSSDSYNPNLNESENSLIFNERYKDEIKLEKEKMIRSHVREYYRILEKLKQTNGIIYWASNGENIFSNSEFTKKEQFESYPSYMLFDNYQQKVYPNEVNDSNYLEHITVYAEQLNPEKDVIYIGFTDSFLNEKKAAWAKEKEIVSNNLYRFIGFFIAFLVAFVYLVSVIGRKSFKDSEIGFHFIDKLYTDINLALVIFVIAFWAAFTDSVINEGMNDLFLLVTVPIMFVSILLILSLIKHFKNKTLLKHTFIFNVFYVIYRVVKHIFDSGSTGVKVVVLVIGYPLLVASTFFMFPVTIGLVVWFAMKKVKSFNRIKEGVEQIKDGHLHHRIEVAGKGEFGQLAENINRITEGLEKSVDSEIKSERLKTELITNVSHDIRTPLTSIITYIDLLKIEKDPEKIEEYVEILDQKSKRLKLLTDDLFEAAKATSGNIPVQLERIDVLSLLTQGIGEMDEKIEASALEMKLSYPEEKVYVKADGKLLWRAIENLFSNIFKYALPSSRVYIDIEDLENEVKVTFKNISAYELNISADELLERFKRGDESRATQGSGLGLSIAESLVHIQHGKFIVEVDGDLFKVTITLPKFANDVMGKS